MIGDTLDGRFWLIAYASSLPASCYRRGHIRGGPWIYDFTIAALRSHLSDLGIVKIGVLGGGSIVV